MNAADIMTQDLVTVDERATVDEALRVMSEKEIRHLPVVRGEEVIGMLSDRDLRGIGLSLVQDLATLDTLRARLRSRVTDLMSADVITIGPETEMSEIIDLLLEEKLSALPVVEGDTNTLIGIVSYVDVLHAMQEELE